MGRIWVHTVRARSRSRSQRLRRRSDASAVILQAREKYLQTHDAFPEGVYSDALPPWQEMVEIKYGFGKSCYTVSFAPPDNFGTAQHLPNGERG